MGGRLGGTHLGMGAGRGSTSGTTRCTRWKGGGAAGCVNEERALQQQLQLVAAQQEGWPRREEGW